MIPDNVSRCLGWLLRVLAFSALLVVTARSAPEEKRSYNLPAGDAAVMLRQFSDISGKEVLYAAEVVRGVQTSAVQGEFTATEALDRMLVGTNLYELLDEQTGAISVLRKSSPKEQADAPTTTPPSAQNDETQGDVVKLSPFEVRSGQDQGYVSSETTSGSRVVTKIFDVPASISVVTRDLIDDLGAVDPWQAVGKAVPAVTTFGLPSIFSGVNIRGFRAQFWSVDGATIASNGPTNNYNLDGMEVIKGPSALLYGPFGAYGGYINILPKWAHAHPVNKLETSVGTDEFTSNMIDIGQEWLESKHLQTRLVAGYLHYDRPGVKGDYTHSLSLAPSLTYEISDKAKLKIRMEWNDRRYLISYVPLDPNYKPLRDKSANTFFKGSNQSDKELITQTILTGALSDEWSYKVQFQTETDHYLAYSGGYTNVKNPPSDIVTIYHGWNEQYAKQWTMDMSTAWDARDFLPGTTNHLVAGASMNNWTNNYRQYNYTHLTGLYPEYNQAPWTTFSLSNPQDVDTQVFHADRNYLQQPYNTQWLGGLMITDTLDLLGGKIKLIGGVRYNYDERYYWTLYRYNLDSGQTGSPSERKVNTIFLHRYGAIFQPTKNIGVYFGHDEGYLAVGSIFKYDGTQRGAELDPETGKNDEVGIKVDNLHALGGSFFGSLSYFQLEVTNKWRGDPDHTGFFLQDGLQKNNGFDAQLAYNSDNKKINLLAGYFSADGPTTASSGARAVYAPKMTANFWGRYNINSNWAVGGGWKRQGDSLDGSGKITVEAFDSVDLFVMYRRKLESMRGEMIYRLGMTNVTDGDNIYMLANTAAAAVEDSRQTKLTVSYIW